MDNKHPSELSDEELIVKKKELKKAKIFSSTAIGILAGILIFGTVSWILNDERKIGFFIPMLIPVVFIYRILKNRNQNKELENVLKERGLD